MSIKVSAKTRYGLRILLDLAIRGNGVQRSVKDIAESQQISDKFISLLVVKLHRGGLIKTVRGIGYRVCQGSEIRDQGSV